MDSETPAVNGRGGLAGFFALALAGVLMYAIMLGSTGCGGPGGRRTLKFFFDGVPEPDSLSDTLNGAADPQAARLLRQQARTDSLNALIGIQAHPPYADRDCSACHRMTDRRGGSGSMSFTPRDEGGSSSWLSFPVEELCFECHSDMTEEYAEENGLNIHDPVASGECVTCHNPHRSPYKALLLKERARELCLDCHDESIPEGEDDHPELEDSDDCTDCHNPHISEDDFLLE
ncbi:MAG: cytochrome c3 family protein [Candidatus Zixiibacteriota bacterium]